MVQHDFSIDTDHFQFYLEDCQHSDAEHDMWANAFIPGILDVYDGGLAVGTARWGLTRVSLVVMNEPPDVVSLSDWNRIAEASIESRSGKVCIVSPEAIPSEATAIVLVPGWYRVRICWDNIHSVEDEMESTGDDRYVLFLWPAPYAVSYVIQSGVGSS